MSVSRKAESATVEVKNCGVSTGTRKPCLAPTRIGEAGLSDRQKVILKLMFDEDMDVEDIAEKLGIAAQTVRSAKHKALTKLRDAFEAKKSTEARGT